MLVGQTAAATAKAVSQYAGRACARQRADAPCQARRRRVFCARAGCGGTQAGLENRISRYFTTDEMLPAAGQGILAVQTRRGMDTDCLRTFHNANAACCALAERAFVRALGGGCSSPVAAYAEVVNDTLTLTGLYVSEDESVVRKGACSGRKTDAEALGCALAAQLGKGE